MIQASKLIICREIGKLSCTEGNFIMEKNTKVAVIILVAAILISLIGPMAIAFAVGYLTATVVNSPSFDKQIVMDKVNQWLQSMGWKKLE